MDERRIRFRDVKPYAVASFLGDLHGPYSGLLRLSHSVLWVPGDRVVDLDTEGGRRLAYQALLAEGTVEDQVAGLNAERLIEEWPHLHLDSRVRNLWENRFPELTVIP